MLKDVVVSTTTHVYQLFKEGGILSPEFFKSADKTSPVTCTFQEASSNFPFPRLDCDALAIGVWQGEAHQYGYDFFSDEIQGNMVKLRINPKAGKSLWFDTGSGSTKWMGGNPIPVWLMLNGGAPRTANAQVELHETASSDSKIVAACPDPVPNERVVEWKGDWMELMCVPSATIHSKDGFAEKAGTRGWARWRSEEGHLLFLPFKQAFCDE